MNITFGGKHISFLVRYVHIYNILKKIGTVIEKVEGNLSLLVP